MNELRQHKRSDKIKWAITFTAIILMAILIVGLCMQLFAADKYKPAEWFKKPEQVEGEQPKDDINSYVVSSMSLYAAAPQSNDGISQTVTAKIYPSTAINKAVDWQLVWADDETPVTSCVTLNVPTDGSLTVTLTCTEAFPDRTMKLICTSRDSGVTASTEVRCEGVPSSMTVDGGSTVNINWSKTSNYAIELSNLINYVGDSKYNALTVSSVTVHGTIDYYDVLWVNNVTASFNDIASASSWNYYSGYRQYNLTDLYSTPLTASISNRKLVLSAIAYPAAKCSMHNNGASAPSGGPGGYGARSDEVYLAPKDVYADVVIATGSFSKTIRVNFIVGVTALSFNSASLVF